MKFSEFTYKRPSVDAYQKDFEALLSEFEQAPNVEAQIKVIDKINDLRESLDTMINLAYINYSQDTTNKAYVEEQEFMDENGPLFGKSNHKYYKALLASPYRDTLTAHYGEHLFNLAETAVKAFDPVIIPLMQKENKLSSEYTKLKASAKIEFEGKVRNLSEHGSLLQVIDRDRRKAASAAKWKFFSDNADEFNRIFDELVKIRHEIALKLGFKNYVEVGYLNMSRTDYNPEMVANYRRQIQETIVPLAQTLRKRQAKRLGISDFKNYDIPLYFNSGNPKPKGSPSWIVENGKKMYEELSSATGEFFNFMIDNELMDLEARKGKDGGGYCTYIADYKSPFIFSNFNGTSHDIDVLTHEAGHAFQVYMSRHFDLPEYHWPTTEACEIHSMSMEFLTYPWMDNFFKEDTDKYKFNHLSNSLMFLPYGAAVDEFQHFVYENPELTPTERNAQWRAIEKKYLPWIEYDNNPFLENGGYWQQQSHIYQMPFYYIDYALAQICAFQFWKRSLEDNAEALNDYIELCKKGGSRSFLKLVESANLESPFDDGTVANAITPVEEYLATVDDSSF